MELCCSRLTSHARASTSGAAAAAGPGGGGTSHASREALLINCMLMLNGALSCDAYHGRMSSLGARDAQQAERTKAMAAAVRAALDQFWSAPFDGAGGSDPQQQQQQQQQPQQHGENGAAAAAAAAAAPPRRVVLLYALMDGLFPLTARELQEWEEDPEAWCHAAEGGAWEDGLRPCAEHLFLQLLTVRGAVEALHPGFEHSILLPHILCSPTHS